MQPFPSHATTTGLFLPGVALIDGPRRREAARGGHQLRLDLDRIRFIAFVATSFSRLVPDHKTIADFRKDNGSAIRQVCARFIALCRLMGLLMQASVAIDGSKFKAVNNRDKNFTRAKMERRMAQIEESVARYLEQLDTADRQEPSEVLTTKTNRLKAGNTTNILTALAPVLN